MSENAGRTLKEMFEAVRQNDPVTLVRLLDEGGDPTDISYEDGYTPLGLAVEEGRTELLKLMLERGADPNGGGIVVTPLEAAENGRLDVLRMLLEAGADPDLMDEDEESARAWAERHGASDVLKMIETCRVLPRTNDKANGGEYIPAE